MIESLCRIVVVSFVVLIWLAIIIFPIRNTLADTYFVEATGGVSQFHQYKIDGARWYQDAFPWSADLQSPAWRFGFGKKINDKWDWTLSWLEIGHNSVGPSWHVADEDYDAVNHQCIRNCDKPSVLWANGSGRGPELAFRHQWETFYVRTGGFLWISNVQALVNDYQGNRVVNFYQKEAYMLAPFLGVGARYRWKPVELFAEVTYYHGIGSGGYPIAKRATVPMIGIRVNFD